MEKSKKIPGAENKIIHLRAEKNLFGQLILLSEAHNISMERALSYPLGQVAWSSATADGCPVKTDKAKLMHHLEGVIPPAEAPSHIIPRWQRPAAKPGSSSFKLSRSC